MLEVNSYGGVVNVALVCQIVGHAVGWGRI